MPALLSRSTWCYMICLLWIALYVCTYTRLIPSNRDYLGDLRSREGMLCSPMEPAQFIDNLALACSVCMTYCNMRSTVCHAQIACKCQIVKKLKQANIIKQCTLCCFINVPSGQAYVNVWKYCNTFMLV